MSIFYALFLSFVPTILNFMPLPFHFGNVKVIALRSQNKLKLSSSLSVLPINTASLLISIFES
jgi:hypothetical protein